jgi:hypothetical protein
MQLHSLWIEEFGAGAAELCVGQSSVFSRQSSAHTPALSSEMEDGRPAPSSENRALASGFELTTDG